MLRLALTDLVLAADREFDDQLARIGTDEYERRGGLPFRIGRAIVALWQTLEHVDAAQQAARGISLREGVAGRETNEKRNAPRPFSIAERSTQLTRGSPALGSAPPARALPARRVAWR